MGIKNIIAKAGNRAADKVARLAVLSPEQLKNKTNKQTRMVALLQASG